MEYLEALPGERAIDKALQKIENDLELTRPEIAFILAERDKGPRHLMLPLLVARLGEARPDLEWHDEILQLSRLRLPTIDIPAYKASIHLDDPRTGPWIASIDGLALSTAMSMIADLFGVFLHTVEQLLIHGTSANGPLPQLHPSIGEIWWATDLESPKHLFIHAMFGKLSLRSSPESLVMDPKAPHYTELVRLVRENIESIDLTDDLLKPWNVRQNPSHLATHELMKQVDNSKDLPSYATLLEASEPDL